MNNINTRLPNENNISVITVLLKNINNLLQLINIINIGIIITIALIIIFQDVKVFALNYDITRKSLLISLLLISLCALSALMIKSFKPKTHLHLGIIIITGVMLLFITTMLINLLQWFLVTEEGMLSYKFIKITMAASYDAKVNAYHTYMDSMINHINDSQFRAYIMQTNNINNVPNALHNISLSEVNNLVHSELAKARNGYEHMLYASQQLNRTEYNYVKIIGVLTLTIAAGACLYFGISYLASYLNFSLTKSVEESVNITKETINEGKNLTTLTRGIATSVIKLNKHGKDTGENLVDLAEHVKLNELHTLYLKDATQAILKTIGPVNLSRDTAKYLGYLNI